MDVSPTGPLVRSSTERDHFRSSLMASSTTKYLSCRSWGLMSDSLRGLTSGDLLMPLRQGVGRERRKVEGVRGRSPGEPGAASSAPAAGVAALPALLRSRRPPASPAAWASGPVSGARLRAPRRRAAWGQRRGRRCPKLPEQLRPRALPPPGPQTDRRPGRQGPPAAHSRTHTRTRGATHMAMLLPLGAPPGNSRIPIGNGRAGPGAPRLEAGGPRALAARGRGPGEVGGMPGEGPRAARARPRRRPRAPPRRAARRGRGGSTRLQPALRPAVCSERRAPLLSLPPPRHTAVTGATEPRKAPAAVCALEAPERAGGAGPGAREPGGGAAAPSLPVCVRRARKPAPGARTPPGNLGAGDALLLPSLRTGQIFLLAVQ